MATRTPEQLRAIFDRSNGICHICREPVSFDAYGRDADEGWEVEHSVPRARGGTDRLNNLYAAHPSCNRAKGTRTSREVRAAHGHTRAPRSRVQVERAQATGLGLGGATGGAIGMMFGPIGILVGTALGAAFGHAVASIEP